uniref:Hepatitis A virus cellular receptor 1-like n=1 Tax=Saccoglossus kowalevskii TaxID=10224 RepID=A0ABM0M922_SACKO|nr:PREDICTED: hepatitis A virus cellular receptor 1-like [Saccoglossus kowalevskii]
MVAIVSAVAVVVVKSVESSVRGNVTDVSTPGMIVVPSITLTSPLYDNATTTREVTLSTKISNYTATSTLLTSLPSTISNQDVTTRTMSTHSVNTETLLTHNVPTTRNPDDTTLSMHTDSETSQTSVLLTSFVHTTIKPDSTRILHTTDVTTTELPTSIVHTTRKPDSTTRIVTTESLPTTIASTTPDSTTRIVTTESLPTTIASTTPDTITTMVTTESLPTTIASTTPDTITTIVTTESLPTTIASTTLGCSRYHFYNEVKMTWESSSAQCVDDGGAIASIHTQIIFSQVRQFIINGGFDDGSTNYWIGLNDIDTEGTFVWANGEPLTFTRWAGSNPNNSGNQDCVQMW